MDVNVKKCCPNCSQLYHLKSAQNVKPNFPLFLACGHTMCQTCIGRIVKFAEPIECKVCHKDMEVSMSDIALLEQKKIKLYDIFPVNLTLLGEISLQYFEDNPEVTQPKDNNHFIDLQAIIKDTDMTQGQCMECHNRTSKMCKQCATILCDACFNKSHKNFVIFKNHVLQNIEQEFQPNTCKLHENKPLDYYCKECSKPVCMDCLVVGGEKSCKNHNVVSMQEVNENFLEGISEIVPKVDETFRRLTKTAVDVGHLLHNMENDTGSTSELTQHLASIEQHMSKLMSVIQKHKKEIHDIIIKLKCSEHDSLKKTKEELEKTIKKARMVMNAINLCSDPKKAKQANLAVLLEDAKEIAETPWYLSRDESKDPLKIVVNEDLCTLVSDYIHLEGNASCVYKLKTTAELGDIEIPPPPVAPVFPPELPKDVRLSKQYVEQKQAKHPTQGFVKNAPQYRSKSASVSSLNSAESGDSNKSNNYVYGEGFQRPMVQPVQPFPESKHPRQLCEGSQELVYITHIVNPHNFFVQRSYCQNTVKEMLKEFRNATSLPKPNAHHIAEGKVYLMFNKADNMWQRCRIVSINRKDINDPVFYVFCIDFGSTESVKIDKLRLLPPARVHSPPPLAINCSLANCEPINGAWTSDDSYLVQNIIDNKQAVIYVRRVHSTHHGAVTNECDVTTFEEGISLAHALVFHERARMPNPKLMYPHIKGAAEKPKLYMNNSDYKQKSVEEVYITNTVSPDKFFVRKRHLQQVYEKLCDDMDQEYGLNGNSRTVYLPEMRMVYAVNMDKYRNEVGDTVGSWARGVVHQLPGRGRVRVLLPDTGHLLFVHWTALRHIQPKFTTLCALSTECHLAGVTPLHQKWSTASVALLQGFEGRLLELHVEDNRGRGSLGVTLYDRTDEENIVCINTEMIKHKFAVTFGLFMFNKNADVENQVRTNKSPLDPPKPQPKKKENEVTILQRKTQNVKKIDEKELEAKDKGPLRLEAKVLHHQSPSLIYVSLVHQQKTFNELYEQIQLYYAEKKDQSKSNWKVDDRCCTFCTQSQTWRRATIVEIDGDNAKVFYSDFACVETVPIANLRTLAPEFASIGDAAIKCHMSGIMPADGSEEWPTITKEYLKDLLDAYPRIFITRLGDIKKNSMPIEIWVYHTILGSALEPNKSEWRCLNNKIVEQGLGIPDKSQPGSSTGETSKGDMLSFLQNVTGSINEWLQLEPMPTKPLVIKDNNSKSNTPSVDGDEGNTISEETTDGSNTIYITDWLPPEPFPCTEFTGMPTYIDNDGVIYLHDVAQQDTLDLIRKALDIRFKSPDPKAKYVKWTVGEPCVAMYYLDNRFYRGRVVDVNKETNACLIHYIDYGNEEMCSFENIRKSIALHQIPTQAHRCALARIRPIGGQWDRQALDYVHKSVVEKQCFVRVTGDPIGGVIPIDLKFDKLWINDHLVDFEMAVYTDGSKAVVKKFAAKKKQEPVVVVPDPDPDYIVEADDSSTTFKSLEGKDWNTLMEEDENGDCSEDENGDCSEGKFTTFPKFNEDEFLCNIAVINDTKVLDLNIIHNDTCNVLYEEMMAEIQKDGPNRPPLNGIYENKACIALFHEDGQWYRASILEYSERESKVKVRYVDYGNREIITVADIREISDAWTNLPPASVQAKLHGININPEIDTSVLSKEYANTFLDKGPFHAKVISYENELPVVALRDDDGELVYKELIERKVFLNVDSN